MWVASSRPRRRDGRGLAGEPGSSTLIDRRRRRSRLERRSRAPRCCSPRSGARTSVPCASFSDGFDAVTVDDITFSPVAAARHRDPQRPGRGVALRRRELPVRRQPGRHALRLLARRRASRSPAGRRSRSPGSRPGTHTLTVGMRDRFGTPDPTPGRVGVDGRPEPDRRRPRRRAGGRRGRRRRARTRATTASSAVERRRRPTATGTASATRARSARRATLAPVTGERVVVDGAQRRGVRQAARHARRSSRRRSRASCR